MDILYAFFLVGGVFLTIGTMNGAGQDLQKTPEDNNTHTILDILFIERYTNQTSEDNNTYMYTVLLPSVREISSCSTFLCGDGECLESDILRCDFYMDCTDGTDEMDCPCDTFRCNDSRCLSSISWRCDEEEHCTDGEDELDCAVTTQGPYDLCPVYECDDGSCLSSYSLICDGKPDCPDHSDERGCYSSIYYSSNCTGFTLCGSGTQHQHRSMILLNVILFLHLWSACQGEGDR